MYVFDEIGSLEILNESAKITVKYLGDNKK